jgi:hypothetical protein
LSAGDAAARVLGLKNDAPATTASAMRATRAMKTLLTLRAFLPVGALGELINLSPVKFVWLSPGIPNP